MRYPPYTNLSQRVNLSCLKDSAQELYKPLIPPHTLLTATANTATQCLPQFRPANTFCPRFAFFFVLRRIGELTISIPA